MFSFFRKGHAPAKPAIPGSNDLTSPGKRTGRAVEPAIAPPPPAAERTVAPAKPTPQPVGKPAREPAAAAEPVAPVESQPPSANGGIQVHEMELLLAPEIEEAVMLYANSLTGEATAALHRYILDHPESRDPLPWYLLFDIYEITGQRHPFEDLAVDFAVRLERSPPTWRRALPAESGKDEPKHPTFAFGPDLSPQDKARLEHFHQECAAAETVALDFRKTPVPNNDGYARTILDSLSKVVGMGKEVRLTGGEAFVVRLNASRSVGQLTEATWLLLLMMLQLLGKADEFDEMALEYAIRFEMSPPSYTPPKHVASEPEEPADSAPEPSDHTFPLHGVLGSGSSETFKQLAAFAAPLSAVEIDLGQVSRVDFAVVGLLMDTVMSMTQAGKRVVFRGGNGMVNLFLQMVGVGQFATIQHEVRK
jgi:anti-anti-sigma regulatory factor